MSHAKHVTGNPNPERTCFCGASEGDCPGGSGWLSPNEIEGKVQGNYDNYISDACVVRFASQVGSEVVSPGGAIATPGRYSGPLTDPETGAWLGDVHGWTPSTVPDWYQYAAGPQEGVSDETSIRPPVSAESFGIRGIDAPLPQPHVNPTADTLEEATDLLDLAAAERAEDETAI